MTGNKEIFGRCEDMAEDDGMTDAARLALFLTKGSDVIDRFSIEKNRIDIYASVGGHSYFWWFKFDDNGKLTEHGLGEKC